MEIHHTYINIQNIRLGELRWYLTPVCTTTHFLLLAHMYAMHNLQMGCMSLRVSCLEGFSHLAIS